MMQKAPLGPFDDVLCGKVPLRDTHFEILVGKKGVWAEAGSFGDTKCRNVECHLFRPGLEATTSTLRVDMICQLSQLVIMKRTTLEL